MYQRSTQGSAFGAQQTAGQALNGEAGVNAPGWFSFPLSSIPVNSVMWFSKDRQIIFGCITQSRSLESKGGDTSILLCVVGLGVILPDISTLEHHGISVTREVMGTSNHILCG